MRSMTAYASRTGTYEAVTWIWEMRGVNGRGLDFKVRLPEVAQSIEAKLRERAKAELSRGVIHATLRINQADQSLPIELDQSQLERVLHALDAIQETAFSKGVTLSQPSTADVLAQRGVIASASEDPTDNTELFGAILEDFDPLLAEFAAMREQEGQSLLAILEGTVQRIEEQVGLATQTVIERGADSERQLTEAMQRIASSVEIDRDRLEQELALIAVKQDVTEELDRLKAHCDACRALFSAKGPVGRKLDFLSQELNREANTLCAKSQFVPLTAIGLELKALIDQLREQIQNVE